MANTITTRSSHPSQLLAHDVAIQRTKQAEKESSEALSSRQKPGGYMNEDVAEHTRTVLKAEQSIAENKNIQSQKTLLTNRINAAHRNLGNLEAIAREFHLRVTATQQPGSNDRTFDKFCMEKLKEVESILNRKDADGRGLHGGKATQNNAVTIDNAPVPGPASTPDATYNSYFDGDASRHTSTLNGESLEYGFHALEPGVRDLIFYLKSGTVTTPDHTPGTPNTQRLQGMQDGLHDVIKSLTDTKADLGYQLGKLEQITDNAQDVSDDSKITFQDIVGVEQWEAWTKNQEAANQLQLMQTLFAQNTRRLQDLFQKI